MRDLKWYVVVTEAAVQQFIPDFVATSPGPFIIIDCGEQGGMVWGVDTLMAIVESVDEAMKQIKELLHTYGIDEENMQ